MTQERSARILVVEDESIVALDIKHRLAKLGYEVVDVVSRGEDAVERATRLTPDAVLMDIMLAGEMDGVEAATAINERANIPVVYLTAYADEATLARAKVTQPFGYIIKPFEDREVHTAIEMACYRHAMDERRSRERRWLETTLSSIDEGIVACGADGKVNYANPKAEELLACRGADIMGHEIGSVLHLSGDEAEEADLSALVDRGSGAYHSDALRLEAGGGEFPVELTVSQVAGQNGADHGVVVAFRNITGRVERMHSLRSTVAKLRQTVDATVQALVVTSEKRDPYTAGHQHRVAKLAVAIARRMGLDGDELDCIHVAGLLHDLGKIYIPAEILSKPARLTDMEFGLMKTHPEVAYDILKDVPFPWRVADIVLQHHERLDGTGYPGRLGAADILPEARIISVADVVEAMSSHRPYRAALGIDVALNEVRRGRGEQYDPDVVDACQELFAEGEFDFEG